MAIRSDRRDGGRLLFRTGVRSGCRCAAQDPAPSGSLLERGLRVTSRDQPVWRSDRIGVMAAGYCFGRVFDLDADVRRKILLRVGASLSVAFVLLRATNLYGDPSHWSAQSSPVFTLLSFLNCTKYPPSLLFLMMTIGPALMVTSWFDRIRFSVNNPLIVFGRVPFFYFLVP